MPLAWYRTTDHGEDAKAEFSHCHSRARHPHRIQYKQIKAVHLIEAGEPEGIRWAQDLLTEITADQAAYRHQRAFAFELLAQARLKAGQWKLAVQALEQCIELTSPTMNGTSGLPDLTLAEVLLDNDPSALPEVESLLDSQPLVDRIKFNSQLFRYLVATARARRALGQDPAPPARRALDLLEDDKPTIPRHPDVGRVHASAQTVRELHDLAHDAPGMPADQGLSVMTGNSMPYAAGYRGWWCGAR
jgi:hypothetical protein